MEILEKIVCVQLDVHIPTAARKLRPEDLKLAELPPEKLVHLGVKKVLDPTMLTPFTAAKKRAERVCLERGTKFLGGFAIPEEELPEVERELRDIKRHFDTELLTEFRAKFQSSFDAWVAENAEYSEVLLRARPTLSEFERGLSFNWQSFKVVPAEGSLKGEDYGLDAHVREIGDGLLAEVATKARLIYDKSFRGRARVGVKAIKRIVTLRNKMERLSFLDGRIYPIVEHIDRVLEEVGMSPAEGQRLDTCIGLLVLMQDPEALYQRAKETGEVAPVKEIEVEEAEKAQDPGVVMPTPPVMPERRPASSWF